jgi:hypothetical protein
VDGIAAVIGDEIVLESDVRADELWKTAGSFQYRQM